MPSSPNSSGPLIRGGYSSPYRAYALFLLVGVNVFNYMDRKLLAVLVEPIKADLQIGDTMMGLMLGFAFSLTYSVIGFPMARLADRGFRVRVMGLALGAWSAMTVLSGFVQTATQMLIARIGVGIGEAGGNPPAQALVAEYFPADSRGKALTVFVSGAYIGGFIGGAAGGLLGDVYSWRTAFIALGIPGLVFGALVLATLKEPSIRKRTSAAGSVGPRDNLIGAIWELFRRPAFRHLMIAVGILYFSSQGAQAWHAAFFMRTHGLSLTEAGGIEGIASLLPAISVIFAGYLTDRLYRRDPTWQVWLPMIATAASIPLFLALYLAPDWKIAALSYIGAQAFAGIFSGIFIVSVQSIVWQHERSLAAAMVMFSASLIGLGAGPLVVGLLSDLLYVSLGDASLQWALVASKVLPVWGIFHLWRAAQTFRNEIKVEAPETTH